MILIIAYSILFLALIIITFQDIKYRAIHIVLPLVVLLSSLIINYKDPTLSFLDFAYNILFIGVNIIGLFVYFSIKEKRVFNPINSMLGIGDILFFIAVTPLFHLKSFILFFILGLIFTLLIHLISNMVKKTETIPLAGYLSIFLAFNLMLKMMFNIEMSEL